MRAEIEYIIKKDYESNYVRRKRFGFIPGVALLTTNLDTNPTLQYLNINFNVSK